MKPAIYVVLIPLVLGQHSTDERQPPLDKKETKKLLKEAESQLAAFRKANPLKMNERIEQVTETITSREGGKAVVRERVSEIRIPEKGSRPPQYTDHEGNPLLNRTCHFDVRYDYIISEKELIAKGLSNKLSGQGEPDDREPEPTRVVVAGKVKASLSRYFKIGDIYPELDQEIIEQKKEVSKLEKDLKEKKRKLKGPAPAGTATSKQRYYLQLKEEIDKTKTEIKDTKKNIGQTLSDFKKEVKGVYHLVHLFLPEGYAPPDKMPRKFDVNLLTKEVKWDENSAVPYLLIRGDLIKSEDLGLNAKGLIQ